MNQNTVRDDQIVRVAHIARDLAHLPGAATPDWCRQAAGVFVKHEPSTRAWVMVIASGDRPDHRRTEASGYAEGPDRAHDPIAARPAVAVTRAVLEALCRIERPGVLSVAALLDIEPRTRGFTVLRRFPRLLVGITELEPPADETPYPRLVLILWDPPEAAGARGALTDTRLVLGSVLPVLGDRLRQALGCRPGCTPWLSECEHRVLNMLTDGLSVPEIAEALGRSRGRCWCGSWGTIPSRRSRWPASPDRSRPSGRGRSSTTGPGEAAASSLGQVGGCGDRPRPGL